MRIAVIGAGPAGLEAATEAAARGHDVIVYESDRIAANVRRWSHITLFTPWSSVVTVRGLERADVTLEDPGGYPTGEQFVDRYLEPLGATLDVREHTRVVEVGRVTRRKGEALGSDTRADEPFRMLVETPDGRDVETADAIFDCSGVFGQPAPVGAGGMSAPGEMAAARTDRVRYGPNPVDDLAGLRVMLVGAGASAVTVLSELLALEPPPEVSWVTASQSVPGFVSPEDDVLPMRRALHDLGRTAPDHPMVAHHAPAQVDRLFNAPSGVRVTLTNGTQIEVDHVLACTGYRPDNTLSRELQYHVCWATEGPMTLAAALMAASGAEADCMDPPELGAEALKSPEPKFFVLGHKSYGRRSDFLLKVGHQQVLDALDLLEGA